jgi:F0F1-type ATP synthase assembly protein I
MPGNPGLAGIIVTSFGLSGRPPGCYTFAAWRGGFPRPFVQPGAVRVLNSMAANRRLAFRMVAIQAAVAALVALAFLFQDTRAALAAAIGGGAMVLGSLLLAWRSMLGPAYSAGLAMTRLISGIVLKWFVVIGALYLALARLGLPPLPLLAGLVGAMAASFLIHTFKT